MAGFPLATTDELNEWLDVFRRGVATMERALQARQERAKHEGDEGATLWQGNQQLKAENGALRGELAGLQHTHQQIKYLHNSLLAQNAELERRAQELKESIQESERRVDQLATMYSEYSEIGVRRQRLKELVAMVDQRTRELRELNRNLTKDGADIVAAERE